MLKGLGPRSMHKHLTAVIVTTLPDPDHAEVAEQELDGDGPLLEEENQHPELEHRKVGPARRVPHRAVQPDIEPAVLDRFRLLFDLNVCVFFCETVLLVLLALFVERNKVKISEVQVIIIHESLVTFAEFWAFAFVDDTD